jgi:hypothetical protein
LLDALSNLLTDRIAFTARRASIDRAASAMGGVTRNVTLDRVRFQRLNKGLCVLPLVGTERTRWFEVFRHQG